MEWPYIKFWDASTINPPTFNFYHHQQNNVITFGEFWHFITLLLLITSTKEHMINY